MGNTLVKNMEAPATFPVEKIRADFPILSITARNKPLVYLDNGATAQKPKCVIETEQEYYEAQNANVHRGVHYLSDLATRKYEAVREIVRQFLNATSEKEIIFTKGTTDGINLVASTFGRKYLQPGDEVLITEMEHHSNIVPWQIIGEERGATLKVIPVNERGEISLADVERLITEKTKIVSVVHVSNTLGTINPVAEIIGLAHSKGIPVLVDGAQAVPHMAVDVQALDADFYVFSAHKLFGPTGTGVLYGKEKWLNALPPYQGGGDMIDVVTFEKTTWNALPYKFEAGTPNIAGVIGMGRAIEYVQEVGLEGIGKHEHDLLDYTTAQLSEIPGLRIIGTAANKASVISFVVEGIHPSDLGTLLDTKGVAVRTGHHCTQPLMQKFGIPGTVRASFAFYNTHADADAFIQALKKAIALF